MIAGLACAEPRSLSIGTGPAAERSFDGLHRVQHIGGQLACRHIGLVGGHDHQHPGLLQARNVGSDAGVEAKVLDPRRGKGPPVAELRDAQHTIAVQKDRAPYHLVAFFFSAG